MASLPLLTLALLCAPAEAATAAADPSMAAWQPAAEPSATPPVDSPVSGDSSSTATPEPASVATAPPAATPSPPAPAGDGKLPDTQPVVRAAPGNWGMTFIFGGLGPLSVAGLGDQPLADGMMFTEIGVRRVFKKFVLPFSFGAGITHRTREGTSRPEVSAGVSGSIAVLKGFRVWRRIAPYTGAFLHVHYLDSPGPNNWLVNLSVGPILGIEYFLADRVSLYGQGIIGIGPQFTRQSVQFVARAMMAAGGQLGLTFYF
ncbi:hypothetical protein [Nannocystis punicea]|uniref:Outer membrane protein beta-barrel domain-containing protein n=1 Tax=Nannocystis punicea TaxID=2995304 RepID=A0ABY7H5M8_9BACT|nr:hypothetical protein [Nannocystis poenicansa]WAS94591.1 hypothetical protein O0S08_00390 [Nannocystis poenicansa]